MAAIAAGLGERSEEIAATIIPGAGDAAEAEPDDPGRAADRPVRGDAEADGAKSPGRRRSATRWCCASRSACVGAITPWNYPLHQIAAKVAPALAAGCTVVLKPSEVTPLNAFLLAEVIEAVGLPAGVFNLVTGTGPVVGEAIAAHPDVDMVSFTGSTRAGKRVSELALGDASSRWRWSSAASPRT